MKMLRLLPLALLLPLSACGSDAVDDFYSYNVGWTQDCTYDAATKTLHAELLFTGSAKGSQTVKATVSAEDRESGKQFGSSSVSARVDGEYRKKVPVTIELKDGKWDKSRVCMLSTDN